MTISLTDGSATNNNVTTQCTTLPPPSVLIYLAPHNGINTQSTDKHFNGVCKLNYIESKFHCSTYGTEMNFKISFKTADGRNVAYVSVILVRLFLVIPGLKHCKIKCTAAGGADKSLARTTSR